MRRILAGLATLMIFAHASAAAAGDYQLTGDAFRHALLEKITNWGLKATIYHGGGGMSTRDSMGCKVSPLRTAAIDPSLISRGELLFIKETVGMPLPGGGVHDGYWYASDTGTGIKGERIDLFAGANRAAMGPLWPFNLKTLTVLKVGKFKGCPPIDGGRLPTVLDGTPAEGAAPPLTTEAVARNVVDASHYGLRGQIDDDGFAARRPIALRVEYGRLEGAD